MEELRLVSKAKILLVEKKQMTEDEAHRFIGKQAMNRGISRRKIAEEILDD
jgi:response regulator NasT